MTSIISQIVYPNPILVIGLLLLMLVDLLTGINKASKQGTATTSKGMRSTFDKGSTYFLFVFSLMIIVNLTNVADADKQFTHILGYSLSGVMLLTCYIEFKSIIENLLIINTNEKGEFTDFAKYFLNPLHAILILKLAKKETK